MTLRSQASPAWTPFPFFFLFKLQSFKKNLCSEFVAIWKYVFFPLLFPPFFGKQPFQELTWCVWAGARCKLQDGVLMLLPSTMQRLAPCQKSRDGWITPVESRRHRNGELETLSPKWVLFRVVNCHRVIQADAVHYSRGALGIHWFVVGFQEAWQWLISAEFLPPKNFSAPVSFFCDFSMRSAKATEAKTSRSLHGKGVHLQFCNKQSVNRPFKTYLSDHPFHRHHNMRSTARRKLRRCLCQHPWHSEMSRE